MISYAQLYEDVLLARSFRGQTNGFYVDVGANHPEELSLTKHFYDAGWRGINIEPGDTFHLFEAQRPRDVNLNVGVAEASGELTFHQTTDRTLSTFSAEVAEHHARVGRTAAEQRTVPVLTLAAICAAHVTGPIDFMNIDVEGSEAAVIAGAEWRRYRPRVVIVESVYPCSETPVHQTWEPTLLANGYHFAGFDLLNRFYVRDEDASLLPVLRAPVHHYDDFVGIEQHRERLAHARHVELLEARVVVLSQDVADQRAQLDQLRGVGPRTARLIRGGKRLLRPIAGLARRLRPAA